MLLKRLLVPVVFCVFATTASLALDQISAENMKDKKQSKIEKKTKKIKAEENTSEKLNDFEKKDLDSPAKIAIDELSK